MSNVFSFRLKIIFLLISIMAITVIMRGALLMLLPSKKLNNILNRQFKTHPMELPRRGSILDRNNQVLAVSFETKSLFLNVKKTENISFLIENISNALNLNKKILEKKMRKKIGFIWIKRHLNKVEEKKIKTLFKKYPELNSPLRIAKEQRRLYPNKNLASHILGFVGTEFDGLEGIEYYYEKILSGKGSFQRKITEKAKEGASLILTIDKALQSRTEKELEKAIQKSKAKSGTAIIMEAETGDIWAMASWPSYDPNKFQSFKSKSRRNRAISLAYEPGSTTKIFLLGGVLEEKLITPKTKFYREEGKMKLGNFYIRDVGGKNNKKAAWLSAEEIIKVSSNIGATKIAFLYGKYNLFNWYKKQGLGEKTGIDLPGEAYGNIKDPSKWSDLTLSNASFGQGFSITAIQLTRAYAAIANGGFLVRPRIVKALKYSNNQVVKKFPVEKKRVLKAETAKELSRILSLVISPKGTGYKAIIPGIALAGKTGTAQVSNKNGYIEGKYVSSFIGYPLETKPKLVTLFLIEEPQSPFIRSGEIAAPAFKNIMETTISRTDIISKDKSRTYVNTKTQENKLQRAINSIKRKQLISLRTAKSNKKAKTMPNFTGKSMKYVLNFFSKKNIKLKASGTGLVVKQYPKEGTPLDSVKEAVIYLKRDFLHR